MTTWRIENFRKSKKKIPDRNRVGRLHVYMVFVMDTVCPVDASSTFTFFLSALVRDDVQTADTKWSPSTQLSHLTQDELPRTKTITEVSSLNSMLYHNRQTLCSE